MANGVVTRAEFRRLVRSVARLEGRLAVVTEALRAVARGAVAREYVNRLPRPLGPVVLVGRACYGVRPPR